MVTIKISQKHVERFVFIVIILILSGLLVNEKFPELIGNEIHVQEDEINEDIVNQDSINQDIVQESEEEEIDEIETTTTTTTTSTTTTTQALEEKLIFSIDEVNYERVDENRGIIRDIVITIRNRLSTDANIEVEYYIYDQTSLKQEKLIPRKPQIVVGNLNSRSSIVEQSFRIDRPVFNLDYDKTIKVEIEDLNSGKIVNDEYIITSTRLKRIN